VLMGAAQAVARSDLDGGVSARLTEALRAGPERAHCPHQPYTVSSGSDHA
jgi:hypothetical protein